MKNKFVQLIYFTIRAAVLMLLSALSGRLMAQITKPPSLHPKLEALAKPESTTNWINFREGTSVNPYTIFKDLKEAFQLSAGDTMVLTKKQNDNLGFSHYRYHQYYKQYKVVYGEFIVHQRPDGFVKSANGQLISGLNLNNVPGFKEEQALINALKFMNAKKYLWQNKGMEEELKRQQKNEKATYYPKGELVYAPSNYNGTLRASDYRLAWHFKIYTDDLAVSAKSVYVDALNGNVIHYTDISMNCSTGTGSSAFNGAVTLHTKLSGSSYRSHNDCQSTNIFVYNCNGGAESNTFYTDADNTWTGTSQHSAVQAQWGVEKTYEYFNMVHGRASWDGVSGDMIAYNNAYLGSNNACWGCAGNATTYYAGNTSAATDDWNTNDIVGHEFAHGVTQSSAGLIYYGESGALNESFSDIFGEMVESWSEGNCDYLLAADREAIRSFINPNAYGQPDTYLGDFWYTGDGDNGGVHYNSGVQNHWFYLLSEGGSGTNDLGQSYNVTGITNVKARQIAYRALVMYLTYSSEYIDARRATLDAASDIYGQCSPEAIAVGNAWHAVGVESQSPQYAYNVCGSYPSSGSFIQAISQLTASNGCITEITPSSTTVYFTARDQVILYPGFRAYEGSKFVAYLDPCSSTQLMASSPGVLSDAEKGLPSTPKLKEQSIAIPSEITSNRIVAAPNPFHSAFDLFIHSKQAQRAQVVIYNSLGVKVIEKQFVLLSKGFSKISFDGSKLHKGVYIVEIHMGSVKTVKKIVKM